jgi:hypothetical protein
MFKKSLTCIQSTLKSGVGGNQPILTSATSVLTSVKAIIIVPSGDDKMDACRENMDVRWFPTTQKSVSKFTPKNLN